MNTFIITYDLNKPGQDYTDLIDAIKSYSAWCNIAKSVWCIITNDTAETTRNFLKKFLDQNDILFVSKVSAPAAWHGEPKEVSEWLIKHL